MAAIKKLFTHKSLSKTLTIATLGEGHHVQMSTILAILVKVENPLFDVRLKSVQAVTRKLVSHGRILYKMIRVLEYSQYLFSMFVECQFVIVQVNRKIKAHWEKIIRWVRCELYKTPTKQNNLFFGREAFIKTEKTNGTLHKPR